MHLYTWDQIHLIGRHIVKDPAANYNTTVPLMACRMRYTSRIYIHIHTTSDPRVHDVCYDVSIGG